jgi:hypothetical protein
MTEYLRTKKFPEDYPEDALAILKAMSFTDLKGLKLFGSMAIRGQLYSADYDGYEIVEADKTTDAEALRTLSRAFRFIIQDLLKMPDVYIGDIKAGMIKEWQVIKDDIKFENGKVLNYNPIRSRMVLDDLFSKDIIDEEDYSKYKKLIKDKPTIEDILEMKKEIKPHIIRWTPEEVIKGFKELKGNKKFTLEEAFSSPAITKLDVIGLVQKSRFTDFSIIYEFKNKGKTLNIGMTDIEPALKESMYAYYYDKNYFKMAKRMFALAKYKKDYEVIKKLAPLFNTDLGLIYSVMSDIGTLIYLVEHEKHIPYDRIKYQIDQFKGRLANVYSLQKWFNEEPFINDRIRFLANMGQRRNRKELYVSTLSQIEEHLQKILSYYTEKALTDLNLLPIRPSYRL